MWRNLMIGLRRCPEPERCKHTGAPVVRQTLQRHPSNRRSRMHKLIILDKHAEVHWPVRSSDPKHNHIASKRVIWTYFIQMLVRDLVAASRLRFVKRVGDLVSEIGVNTAPRGQHQTDAVQRNAWCALLEMERRAHLYQCESGRTFALRRRY